VLASWSALRPLSFIALVSLFPEIFTARSFA
jgi:hypothetical protein